MNPAMGSWMALRQRVRFEPGQSVLVLGAGNAGQMAVQVARLLGADRIVVAGRRIERVAARLSAAGATGVVSLDEEPDVVARRLGEAASEVDAVLDFLWGEPTAVAMAAVITARADRGKPLSWIEVGSVAGQTAAIPSAALRAARLTVVGSGQGSVGAREYLGELPALAEAITAGGLDVDARAVPLADVERAWADTGASPRIVITPRP